MPPFAPLLAIQIKLADLELALVDKDEAAKVLPDLFDRQRRTRAGEVDRGPGYWNPTSGFRSVVGSTNAWTQT